MVPLHSTGAETQFSSFDAVVAGILVPYMLGQLANRLKTWRMKKKAQEEARILRLKASKRASGVSAQESSTTDSESENEDTLLGSNQGTKEPKGTKPDGTKSQLSKVPDLRSLLTSVTHELSYVFLTNAIYFSSCYFWTGTKRRRAIPIHFALFILFSPHPVAWPLFHQSPFLFLV